MGLSKGAVKIREQLKLQQLNTHGYLFCEYCKSKVQTDISCLDNTLTVDHVIPKSEGGLNTKQNLVICCGKCNNLKADMTVKALFNRLKIYNICVVKYNR